MVDLHTHSTASDGSLSPTQLVGLARETGISCLALTDHNTAKGLPEFLAAAKGTSLWAVAGAELSCQLEGKQLHILALDLPEMSFSQLETVLSGVQKRAEESKRELVENLRRAGYQISYEAIQKENPKSIINRAHIAMALQKAGYVPTVEAAFQKLLRESAGYYHPPRRLGAVEALGIIRELGAVSVWAHPFLKLGSAEVKHMLELLTPRGLVGMETCYSTYTPQESKAAAELADAFHLKASGGSDFHGEPKPEIRLGTGRGNLRIPEDIAWELLRDRRR